MPSPIDAIAVAVYLPMGKPTAKKIALICAYMFCGMAFAANLEQFDAAGQRERYLHLISELRCLVCQNQSLAESNAELAKDMRAIVGNMISTGAKDREIIDFMISRYGDFVHYRPPFNSGTLALWLGPFLLLLAALAWLPSVIRKQKKVSLAAAESEQAAGLLRDK